MERNFFSWIVYILENYGTWFLRGTGTTLLISFLGTLVGFLIGLGICTVKTAPQPHNKLKMVLMKIVNIIFSCYVEIFRGTPMICLLYTSDAADEL